MNSLNVSELSNPSEFARWEKRFSVPDYIFGTEPNVFLKAQAALLPPTGTALAIADGEGRNGVWLAERGLDVVSIDWSSTAQRKAQDLARQRGVPLRTARVDLVTWEWPIAAYDVIAAIFFQFLTPPERERVFAGIRQALRPGGLILIEGYRPEQLNYKTGGPSQVENLYTRRLLEDAFAGFSELQIHEHDSMTAEGTGHVGMAALIDLVGRK
jgi:cyclopropane fatty-acyl-phospholipid synthase-like methyltransferase